MTHRIPTPGQHDSAGRRSARAGYTLLELAVVASILVILTAIAIPITQTMLADTRQTAACDMVRARLADARFYAMEQGKPFRFSFVDGTGRFQVAAEDDQGSWDNVQQNNQEADSLIRDTLPEGVLFARDPNAPSGGGGWEPGIVYLPDGSARDDAILAFSQDGLPPRGLRLRGLTGAVSPLSPEELENNSP